MSMMDDEQRFQEQRIVRLVPGLAAGQPMGTALRLIADALEVAQLRPDALRLNARQISALYALRGTVKLHGELEVEQHDAIAGRWLRVEHPDGRCWLVSPDGATHVSTGPA